MANLALGDERQVKGHFDFRLLDNAGEVLWEEGFDNLVTTLGLNQLASAGASGSTGYMGLISSVGYSTLVAGDSMTSHAGWNEAQNSGTNTPPYGTTRPTLTWNTPASGIITTQSVNFVFTNTGSVQGAFITNGSGASATVANTGGVLFSEGLFTGAPLPVASGYTFQATYTLTL